MKRRHFVQSSLLSTTAVLGGSDFSIGKNNEDFPMMDLHCHMTNWFTIDNIMEISKPKARNVAIERNQMAHVPHEEFILMAKAEGLKFSFGSDSRNPRAGYLPYCEEMIHKCKLNPDDMFVPGKS